MGGAKEEVAEKPRLGDLVSKGPGHIFQFEDVRVPQWSVVGGLRAVGQ